MEIGQGQSDDIRGMIERMPVYERLEIVLDEAGIDRIVIAQRAR